MTRSNRLFHAATLCIAALTVGIVLPTAVHAQVYDVAADFSFTTNPATPWTYAFSDDFGGPLTPLDVQFGAAGELRGWTSSIINVASTPTVYRNDSPEDFLGVPVGSVAVHPGPGPDGSNAAFAVIRFTAPDTGLYTLNAQFLAGDSGNTDAYILLNSLIGSPLFSTDTTGNDPTFAGSVALNAGDRLDFLVGTGGDDFFGDTTPVSIRLTAGGGVTAPEPGAAALTLPAIGLLGIALSRRKVA